VIVERHLKVILHILRTLWVAEMVAYDEPFFFFPLVFPSADKQHTTSASVSSGL